MIVGINYRKKMNNCDLFKKMMESTRIAFEGHWDILSSSDKIQKTKDHWWKVLEYNFYHSVEIDEFNQISKDIRRLISWKDLSTRRIK